MSSGQRNKQTSQSVSDALKTLDDASLRWLESLSLDDMDAEFKAQWQRLLEPPAGSIGACEETASQPAPATSVSAGRPASSEQPAVSAIHELITAYRRYGHLYAHLNPLEKARPPKPPMLELAACDLADADLAARIIPDGVQLPGPVPLAELIAWLEQVYCNSIGVELHQGEDSESGRWLLERLEQRTLQPPLAKGDRVHLLQRLIAAEDLELYLGRRYPGVKRFGLEGAESMIPLMDTLIDTAADGGAQEICIGMAHRGRLNVLVNLFGKPTEELFAEFDGTLLSQAYGPSAETGDVKYHQGFSSNFQRDETHKVHLSLSFNPSHLEAEGPVVQGSVRARQERRMMSGGDGRREALAILLHGDAAFSGQGVVMETFQMAATRAYGTGGTVHVVINNQIGYTVSNPQDARSTRYCTDVARIISAPVLHVNGDDPEAVIFVAALAMAYRYRFGSDIVLDLVCFRRLGHNEADEPAATQPLMYKAVRKHPGVRNKYADYLEQEGMCSSEQAEVMATEYRNSLDAGAIVTHRQINRTEPHELFDWTSYLTKEANAGIKTALTPETIKELAPLLIEVPKDFKLLRQVERILQSREQMLAGEVPLDWGCAEVLAYGSLLHEGYPIRFTGQDCRRGTFAHRHLTLFDQNSGAEHLSLQKIADKGGGIPGFYDSFLSEEAVLAFEYGYSATWPTGLVVWEAQFGDFANGAQVVIDQFIVSGEQKWNRLSGLVLLLPHGHEGQGPEHSSARLERFMQLGARDNIQLCVPSTPAQLFHLLRRQVLRPLRRPLVVMTPKSLLRYPASASPLKAFTAGGFQPVLDDVTADPERVRRIVLCSGRIFYPLQQMRDEQKVDDTAIVRLEQLYPFPYDEVKSLLEGYKNATKIIWCQEDPVNQGAWYYLTHRFFRIPLVLERGMQVQPVAREAAAAPAVGWPAVHQRQEEQILRAALGLNSDEGSSSQSVASP